MSSGAGSPRPVPGRPAGGLPFTRRQRWLALAVIAVAVALAAGLDVVHRATPGQQAADLRAFDQQLRLDVRACAANLADGWTAYQAIRSGASGDVRTAVRVARDGEPLCAPAGNSDLYDLATTQPPRSLADFDLPRASAALGRWAFPDAAGVLVDVIELETHPADRAADSDLRARCAALRQDASTATAVLDLAARRLHTTLASLGLMQCSA